MHRRWLAASLCCLSLAACQSVPLAPLQTVAHVDLQRYMGDWYVIANIPPFIEKRAHNSVESYRLDPDGTIATRFTYRSGGFDSKVETLDSRGFVLDKQTNATWGVQLIWPIKADYRIVHLADDYSQAIVARQKRDYVWILARTPSIAESNYQRLVQIVATMGYDVSRIQKVPQKWS